MLPQRSAAYYVVNAITFYRVIAVPFLLVLIFNHKQGLFAWMLTLSFGTDFIDGWLSRKFGVVTIGGAKLDSIGDDLTVAVATIAVFVFNKQFIMGEWAVFVTLFTLFLIQIGCSLFRYGKPTSFHTYAAKIAAIFQGCFFIAFFFSLHPPYLLFYLAALITGLEILEEIFLVLLLDKWEANVKGIFWKLNQRRSRECHADLEE